MSSAPVKDTGVSNRDGNSLGAAEENAAALKGSAASRTNENSGENVSSLKGEKGSEGRSGRKSSKGSPRTSSSEGEEGTADVKDLPIRVLFIHR